MSNFSILRTRHNQFIGFKIDGYTVKSWEELQRVAEKSISRNSPDWQEIDIDGDGLQSESQAILEQQANSLLDTTIRQTGELVAMREELENTNFKLTQSIKTQHDLIKHFERFKTDGLDRLRAIKMLISASIRDCNIGLNHRARDERLKHLSDVIDTQISESGCFTLRTYEDDF